MIQTYLLRYLTKIVYESNDGISFQRIINAVDVNISFIEEIMVHIRCVYSSLPCKIMTYHHIESYRDTYSEE